MENNLSVRELIAEDIPHIINYWIKASKDFLHGMGADPEKLPTHEQWQRMISEQLTEDYNEKKSYCLVWLLNDEPVGHCNVNKIVYGKEAYMHLHLWKSDKRTKGLGTQFVKMTIPYFFNNLRLETLFCEPYALNDAPNKTLPKLGFGFVKEYVCTPGGICFEQPVKLWKMDKKLFDNLYTNN